MNRGWIATGIAVVLSLPLVPFIITGVEHLTGTDAPTVVAGQGWRLDEAAKVRLDVVAPRPGTHVYFIDPTPSLSANTGMDGMAATILRIGRWPAAVTPSRAGEGLTVKVFALPQSASQFAGWAGTDFVAPVTLTAEAASTSVFRLKIQAIGSGSRGNEIEGSVMPCDSRCGSIVILARSGTWDSNKWRIAGDPADFPLSLNVSYLAQFPSRSLSLGPLPNPKQWTLAANAYSQLASDWTKTSQGIGQELAGADMLLKSYKELGLPDSLRTNDSLRSLLYSRQGVLAASDAQAEWTRYWFLNDGLQGDAGIAGDVGIKRIENTSEGAAEEPSRQAGSQTVGRGWYALNIDEMPSRDGGRLALDFQPEGGQKKKLSLIPVDGTASGNVGWIYFNRPGTLQITTTGSRTEPTVRGMGFAELISKSRNTGFAKAELTVTLLCDVLPMGVWILVICGLRWLAYSVIRRLPRTVRKHAQREVDLVLAVAKWAGVGCYVVCAIKDVFVGVGIA